MTNTPISLPFTVERPWGEFRQFTNDEKTTVKIITVKKGGTLSLQTHSKRAEFWKIIRGNPDVTIGDEVFHGKVGDEFNVPIGVKHQISAPNDEVQFLEVSRGEFMEDDITRYEDKYGRA